ncbi:MAG: MFS transporter [Candidatus Heimdallarchaeota archaeon]
MELYLKPSLLLIALYQLIVTVTFTAQQFLLAAYLDELGFLLISGIILAVYFVFWFTMGPFCGALSDEYGLRRQFLILSNLISSIGFIGMTIIPDPSFLFLMNMIIGIGSSLRLGSIVALWVQNSPPHRTGESMAYVNVILVISGILGIIVGAYLWIAVKELSFVLFGIFLILSAIPILFIHDDGSYSPFSIQAVLLTIKGSLQRRPRNRFFFSKPIIQLTTHWLAFSAIISFGTFIIPIMSRLEERIPPGTEIPMISIITILIGCSIASICGLLVWGAISDRWARRRVLGVGFFSTCLILGLMLALIQLDYLVPLVIGLSNNEIWIWVIIGIFLSLIFLAVSLVPTPMAWAIDRIGEQHVAKAMSLRQAMIGGGTIIGTIFGGIILGIFDVPGLLLAILVFLCISMIILI